MIRRSHALVQLNTQGKEGDRGGTGAHTGQKTRWALGRGDEGGGES